MRSDLRITAKVSQNLHAELDLRAVGRARRNVGSVEAGLDELKAFLTEAGVDSSGYNINDGSGLARLNLVSPATVVKLLSYMYASPARDNFLSILPVGGQDGTLNARFSEPSIAGRIHVHAVTQLEIASTDLRALILSGRVLRYLVPDAVRDLIVRTGCYASAGR